MTRQNSFGVSIDSKYRIVAGVKQNGIGGFGAYAVERQQFYPQLHGWRSKHPLERASIATIQKFDESLEPSSFLAEITGRPDQLLKFAECDVPYPCGAEHMGRAKIG